MHATMDLKPIRREGLPEQIARRILDLIQTGALKPGDQLESERDLAARLEVSRPSIREALRALSIIGVLNVRHGGGAFVASLDASRLLGTPDFAVSVTQANLDELFQARIYIEGASARLATPRIAAGSLLRLDELVHIQAAGADDADLFHDTDIEFHRIITEGAAGNRFVARTSQALQVLSERCRHRLSRNAASRRRSIVDHRAIAEALSRRDADAAAQAMETHLRHVRAALPKEEGK